MKILYDHQCYSMQNYGGISRYFSELMKYYSVNEDIQVNLSIKYSNNYYLSDIEWVNYTHLLDEFNLTSNQLLSDFSFKGKQLLLQFLNKRNSKRELLNGDYDIFHPTYYDPYFLKYIQKVPFVLTIHDMIHEIYPNSFFIWDKVASNKKLLATHADKIIAVSENTKKDILNYLNIDEEKIEVVYHGYSPDLINIKDENNLCLPDTYILYVGDRRTKYKNFKFFAKSISPILRSNSDLYLLCVGGGGLTRNELNLFRELNISFQVKQFTASKIELGQCYKNALVFVYPSLYEGFGLPILEAFSCGAPVVLSNSSCLPEVAGDAGIYFDPESEESIKSSVNKVIYDEKLRNKLKREGFIQLKKFSWTSTAAQTKQIYDSLL